SFSRGRRARSAGKLSTRGVSRNASTARQKVRQRPPSAARFRRLPDALDELLGGLIRRAWRMFPVEEHAELVLGAGVAGEVAPDLDVAQKPAHQLALAEGVSAAERDQRVE